jgi:hypothetical protein
MVGNVFSLEASSSSSDISMYSRALPFPFAAGTDGSLSNLSSSASVSISFDFAARFDLAGGTLDALVSRLVRVEIFDLGETLNLRRFGDA